MKHYDLILIGHVTIDHIEAPDADARGIPGGAPFYGAFAACWSKKKIAIITRMAEKDKAILQPLIDVGVDVYLQPTHSTTHMRVIHPTGNVDERLMIQTEDAGFFVSREMPSIAPCLIHLGGLTDREFTIEWMHDLKQKGFRLSVDMQSFVRQVDPRSGVIHFKDVPQKREIVSLADFVKLDIVEAEILTGTFHLKEAAALVEEWGATETVLTCAEGVFVQHNRETFFESFSNRNTQGRTGRGDTVMGAYLIRRIDHDVLDSLAFATALASIKMESPGPFRGTLEDVLLRIGNKLASEEGIEFRSQREEDNDPI